MLLGVVYFVNYGMRLLFWCALLDTLYWFRWLTLVLGFGGGAFVVDIGGFQFAGLVRILLVVSWVLVVR